MRRVLVLAYHFPPVGGGGVQRTLKFVRHLPELGWEPVVLTGPGTTDGRWTPTDDSLTREIPRDLDVVRLGREPGESGLGRRRVERWLRTESPFRRWWIDGTVEMGVRLPSVDLVYASMSPFESGEAAALIAVATGLPWVADLRDPWALDEVAVYPTRLHRERELRRMREVLSGAAAVIMNTPEAARRLLEFLPELDANRIFTIPNGYDEEDFRGPEPAAENRAFRIVHAGYLHTELGHRLRRARRARRLLGGWDTDVDLATRSHLYLVDAVENVSRSGGPARMPIEVHLAGVASDHDRAARTSQCVRYRGYLPHAETVDLVRSADLLFLPMHDLPDGVRATIVPGKTYEYLASGRPILAAVPDGDARDLLAQAPTAHLCRPNDTAGMAGVLADLIARRATGRAPTVRPAVAAQFERRLLTERLVETFDSAARSRVRPTLGAAA